MTAPSSTLPPGGALRIEQVCASFQEAWKAGDRPRIEDFLGDGPERFALMCELIGLEIANRRRCGETIRADDYAGRFPELPREWLTRAVAGSDPTEGDGETGRLDRLPPPPPGRAPNLGLPAPAASGQEFSRLNFGDYEVLGELGRGGMGVVYRAWDLRLKRIVALKLIQPGAATDPQALARFRTEAEAVARLQHPNIVQIHEVGEADGSPYCVLEHVDGGNLAERIAGTPQAVEASALLVAILARAMQAAHDAGIVHRDLKPGNILLADQGHSGGEEGSTGLIRSGEPDVTRRPPPASPFGKPKITDFGLAKLTGGAAAGQTQSGAILGTPSYMAPEQAAGKAKDVGPAADIYGLGAILYELLTGRPPFRGETPMDTLVQVMTGDPVPPSRLRPQLPRDVEVVCLKCLEKEPARRYDSAAALSDELQRFLANEPIQARPLSAPARLWRWCRRKPALATASGIALAALLAVIILSISFGIWQSHAAGKLRDALGDAQTQRKSAQRLSAGLALDRGISLCEQGEIARGLLWLTRSLEIATEAGATDLEPPIRANLAAWRRHLFPLRARMQHRNMVWSAVFSPDGKLLLTSDTGDQAQLWDADTGKAVGPPTKIPIADDTGINLAAFNRAGSAFLTAGYRSGKIYVWDTKTGRQIGSSLDHPGGVTGIDFSRNGKLILTGGHLGMARLWDAETYQPLGEPISVGKGISAVAFDPTGDTCVTGCDDGTVLFWDIARRRPKSMSLVHRRTVTCIAFRPDGKVLLTGSHDGFARLWDVTSGKLLREVEAVHALPLGIASVAFSPDGKSFLTGDFDRYARLWDAASGVSLGALQQRSTVRAVAFSPNGRRALTASNDMTARLWDVPLGTLADTVLAHPNRVSAVAFSPNGRFLATGCRDSLVRLWETAKGRHVRALTGHLGWVKGVAFSPDNLQLATVAYKDDSVRLWNVHTGKQSMSWKNLGHRLQHLAFSPDGDSVLVGSFKSAPQLWKSEDKRRSLEHDQLVNGVAFSPDGRFLATASADLTARLWDANTGTMRFRLQHPAVASGVAFSPDSKLVVTGCADTMARFWNVETAQVVGPPLVHGRWIAALAYSPNGRFVATTGGFTARLWDAASRHPIGPFLEHEGYAMAVAFSPDGRTLLTGSDDKSARLWSVPVPLSQKVNRLVAWVQAVTGLELDAEGAVQELDDIRREERWQRLRELGGPPE